MKRKKKREKERKISRFLCCNFAHFDPIGGLHARPLDPSLPFFGHDGLQQLTQVPFQFDSG